MLGLGRTAPGRGAAPGGNSAHFSRDGSRPCLILGVRPVLPSGAHQLLLVYMFFRGCHPGASVLHGGNPTPLCFPPTFRAATQSYLSQQTRSSGAGSLVLTWPPHCRKSNGKSFVVVHIKAYTGTDPLRESPSSLLVNSS